MKISREDGEEFILAVRMGDTTRYIGLGLDIDYYKEGGEHNFILKYNGVQLTFINEDFNQCVDDLVSQLERFELLLGAGKITSLDKQGVLGNFAMFSMETMRRVDDANEMKLGSRFYAKYVANKRDMTCSVILFHGDEPITHVTAWLRSDALEQAKVHLEEYLDDIVQDQTDFDDGDLSWMGPR